MSLWLRRFNRNQYGYDKKTESIEMSEYDKPRLIVKHINIASCEGLRGRATHCREHHIKSCQAKRKQSSNVRDRGSRDHGYDMWQTDLFCQKIQILDSDPKMQGGGFLEHFDLILKDIFMYSNSF